MWWSQRGRKWQHNIDHARCMLYARAPGHLHTHARTRAFPRQQWFRERASVLCYTSYYEVTTSASCPSPLLGWSARLSPSLCFYTAWRICTQERAGFITGRRTQLLSEPTPRKQQGALDRMVLTVGVAIVMERHAACYRRQGRPTTSWGWG